MALRSSSSPLLTLHASDHNTSDYHVFVSRCYCYKSNYIIIVIYFVRGVVWRGLVWLWWCGSRCAVGWEWWSRGEWGSSIPFFFAWWYFSTLHEETFLRYNGVIQFMLFQSPAPLGWCCSLAPCCGVVVLSCLLRLDGGAFPSAVIGWVVLFGDSFPLFLFRGGGTLPSLTWCSNRLCHLVVIDVFKSSLQGGGVNLHHPKEE